jgi:hypothetical protein
MEAGAQDQVDHLVQVDQVEHPSSGSVVEVEHQDLAEVQDHQI